MRSTDPLRLFEGAGVSEVVVEADGGSRGNPGPAGYGAVVLDPVTGQVLAERKEFVGTESNNVAEYRGLIAGLQAAAELGASAVHVRMDSKLVIEQMSGRWQIKHPAMRTLARQAAALRDSFDSVSFEWIPREKNKLADRLANEAMDAGTGRSRAGRGIGQGGVGRATPDEDRVPTGTWLPPSSSPTRLILLRHGVTAYTVQKRFAGRSDLPLSEEGFEQATAAAKRVVAFAPTVVISSPLLRTRQTAAASAGLLDLPVETADGLVETDFGDWDGFTFAELQERWPGQLSNWLADPAVAPPAGESFEAVTRRVRRALASLLSRHRGHTVLVVSHVTPIKIIVRLALDAPPAALHRMHLQPASISAVDYFDDGNCSLRVFNDTAHLGSRL